MSGFLDPTHLINTFGLLGMMLIIFAECGLLVGFFLPGDSLLFTGGLLAATGLIAPLWVLLLALPVAAIAGNLAGYWIGRAAGPAVFSKPSSRLFRPEYVERSQAFFDRNGARTIVLARFVPIVRTFATVMAGASRMDLRRYALHSAVGGVLWTTAVTLLGYWLGQVALVRDHVELFILGIVALSLVPVVVEVVRSRRSARSTR
ncbi:membrane-associated protein [Modestobacter sp. DSM 44400]|uniref:DedA family protein n=1 Tax=Modestobacter sp. DSM 44400 TaxID=1550230 RepID=UPI00089A1A73|nr:VTT domain-containing protein [Modestobacter sp. DSM 44400]SDX60259.1 membrane-associated protein [Modestobacter sp. DSM 44400]